MGLFGLRRPELPELLADNARIYYVLINFDLIRIDGFSRVDCGIRLPPGYWRK